MSAVSSRVTPRSRARWMVAIDSSSSAGPVGEVGHAHAAEALGRDGQASSSESARWDRHECSKVENDQRPEYAPIVTVMLTPGRA